MAPLREEGQKGGSLEKEWAVLPVEGSRVRLKLEVNFEKMQDTAAFYYQEGALGRTADGEGGAWKKLGPDHKLYFKLDHFCGCRFGLVVYSTQEAGGSAEFRNFIYSRR